jgi:hypothetical protein
MDEYFGVSHDIGRKILEANFVDALRYLAMNCL